ncbi:hypothetical protein IFM89_004260 [Coptis chinensis]|uniref:Uncharacterized protein n=1 Tax=Coptis chinensis TaxID=261450 RepID=A0A835LZ30_9MAGN|nr:hypothetical protein IFM89_004260 [Coptis chinensis]
MHSQRVTLLRLCRTRELHELGSESLFKVDGPLWIALLIGIVIGWVWRPIIVMPTCGGERWRSGMDTYDGSFYTGYGSMAYQAWRRDPKERVNSDASHLFLTLEMG